MDKNKAQDKPKALGVDDVELADVACAHCKKHRKLLQNGQFHCKYCGVMCENCAAEHQKIPKDKGHWAQKLKPAMRDKEPSIPTFNHVMKCEKHLKHHIRGYCLDHGELCCKECLKSDHAFCALENLETMSEGVTRETHMLDATHELADLQRRCKRISQTKRKEIINMAKQADNFESYMKKIRERLITLLDNMVSEIIDDKDKFCKAEAELIEKDATTCAELEKVLNSVGNNLDQAFRGGKKEEMWVAVKKLETIVTHYDQQIANIENEKSEVKFEFVPNKSLHDLLETSENVGKMRIMQSRLFSGDQHEVKLQMKTLDTSTPKPTKTSADAEPFVNQEPWKYISLKSETPSLPSLSRGPGENRGPAHVTLGDRKTPRGGSNAKGNNVKLKRGKSGLLVGDFSKTKANYRNMGEVFGPVDEVKLTYIGRKEVMTSEDSQLTCITGSTFLPNGRLVLVDNHNKTLKLYNAEFELLTGVLLHERPWNVASCYKTTIAVSYPYDMSVDLIETGLKMTFVKKIKTDRPCRGVGYHCVEKWLYIVCGEGNQAQVQAYSLEGQLRKVIIPKQGVFHEPCYLVMSPDCSKLFISDLDNGVVGFNTKTGDVLCHYKDPKIKRYWDLKLDADGRVFVLTTEPNCLYVLMGDHNGQLVKELKIGNKPLSLSYGTVNRDLVITRWTAEDVEVYRFV